MEAHARPHYQMTHMIITWPSHDYHMTITWLPPDHHMTIIWYFNVPREGALCHRDCTIVLKSLLNNSTTFIPHTTTWSSHDHHLINHMPTHNMITSAYTILSGHSQILSWQPCKVKSESGLGMKPTVFWTVTLPTLSHSPHCHTVAIHEETELSRWVGGGADCQKVHEALHNNTSCIHPVLGSR